LLAAVFLRHNISGGFFGFFGGLLEIRISRLNFLAVNNYRKYFCSNLFAA
jgi:hypothetical protein